MQVNRTVNQMLIINSERLGILLANSTDSKKTFVKENIGDYTYVFLHMCVCLLGLSQLVMLLKLPIMSALFHNQAYYMLKIMYNILLYV